MEFHMNTEHVNLTAVAELSADELDAVVGGDKNANGTKGTSGGKNNTHDFLVVKMTEVFISM
jgi:hypothetical protein